jgi:hypothetical protein
MAKNYTLGRGEIHFSRFKTGTQDPEGFRYIGNSPEFNITVDSNYLDHYDADQGIKQKDQSVPLEVNRTSTFTTDNIDPENLAIFFFGSASSVAVVAATVTDESITGVIKGLSYQLGVTVGNPQGARALDIHTLPTTNVIVTNSAGTTTYVEGTDYTIDMTLGLLTIVASGAIVSNTNILVDYKVKTSTRDRIITGSTPVEGAIKYISRNPVGSNFDWLMPYVKLSPNGDFALKGDDWQIIPFNVEILKKANAEAIYVDGRGLTA